MEVETKTNANQMTENKKSNKYSMKSKKFELIKKSNNDLNKSNISEVESMDLNKIREAM